MKMLLTLLAGSALGLITSSAVVATDADPWRNHAEPFVFRFGNEIDLHQQTQKGRDGSLFGFLLCAVHWRDHPRPLPRGHSCRLRRRAGLHGRLDVERCPRQRLLAL